jgi:3-oxoacyl-[acyl-carrier-protein] synthase II
VTGLGAVTPLGVGTDYALDLLLVRSTLTYFPGVRRTWRSVLDGKCGIVSTTPLGPEFEALPSRVAGLVPKGGGKDGRWDAAEHVTATV